MAKHRLRTSGLQLQYLARCQYHPQLNASFRYFSRSPSLETTNLRKDFWKWIDGPGKYFKDPISKHNYLGAYDKSGQPINPQSDSSNPEGLQVMTEQENEENEEKEDEEYEEEEEEDEEQDGVEGEDAELGTKKAKSKDYRSKAQEMRPFPLNKDFKSETVLSESLRDEIYRQVTEESRTVREVSGNLGIDMRRIGAVVRLKTIERDWIRQGKPLAKPYAKAVMNMLPQTPFKRGSPPQQHESINDLPVHAATTAQLFYPTSESRQFTRTDAGKAFDPELFPADARIPHPELIELEKDRISGVPQREQLQRHAQRLAEDKLLREEQKRISKEKEDKQTTIIKGRRWDFKFRDVNAEAVGKDGRSPTGVGWRYGMPFEDRKRGQVKIPTSVP